MPTTEPPVLRALDALDQPDLPLATIGPIAIIAPHPDDETLGCGGLMALCARLHVPVTVIAMTDGEGSHPGSLQTTPEQLIRWRAEERARALTELGAQEARIERLRLPDGGMRDLSVAARQHCVRQLVGILRRDCVQTLLVTAPDDDHPDHQASYALVRLALTHMAALRTMLYAVWPPRGVIARGARWSLNIADVQERKIRAITCFTSQRGEIVKDDPAGFIMPQALLTRSQAVHELFYPDK